MAEIDLDNYRSHRAKVYSGRERGKQVRRDANLDEVEEVEDDVVVIVPDDVFALTSSFFLGMLGDSIRKFGREEFLQRYTFEGPIIENVIEDGIEEALREEAPLEG